jgi:hypothetical protein
MLYRYPQFHLTVGPTQYTNKRSQVYSLFNSYMFRPPDRIREYGNCQDSCITEEACICLEFSVCFACCPVSTRRGESGTNYRRFGRGPGAQLCCICFCLSWYCHYLSTVHIKPFTPSPRHSAIDGQSFWIIVQTFSRSAFAGGEQRNFSIGAQTCCRRPCCCPSCRSLYTSLEVPTSNVCEGLIPTENIFLTHGITFFLQC